MHILDLVQNSITAGASVIKTDIIESKKNNLLTIRIVDDGCGMSKEFVEKVVNPFTTTRTTRKVGLGIPMFMINAQACGGDLVIDSQVGHGTTLSATFELDHIDRPPLGNIADTMATLILGCPHSPDFTLLYETDEQSFNFDTREIKQMLEGVPLDTPEVLAWMRGYLLEGIESVHGGA